MTIKEKVQRKLDHTFQIELNLYSLCGPTPWWQRVVCAGLEIGHDADCQVHICLGDAPAGSEAGWASAPLPSSRRCSAAP